MVKMVPHEAFACSLQNILDVDFFLWKETRLRQLMSSPGASSAGPSTPPSYSSGPLTPPSYSLGPSTPPNYSSGFSGNAECSNCKHLRGKISVLKATLDMHMHLEQHTVNSAALLHEVLNEMEKLDLDDMVSSSNAPLGSISKNLTFQTTTADLVTNFMCIDTGVSHLQIPPSPLPPSTAHPTHKELRILHEIAIDLQPPFLVHSFSRTFRRSGCFESVQILMSALIPRVYQQSCKAINDLGANGKLLKEQRLMKKDGDEFGIEDGDCMDVVMFQTCRGVVQGLRFRGCDSGAVVQRVWFGGSIDELEAEMLQGQKLQVEWTNITVIIVSWPLVIVIFTTAYIVVSGWLEMFPLFTTVHEICIGRPLLIVIVEYNEYAPKYPLTGNEDMDVSKGDGKFIHTTKKDVTSHDFTATHGSNIVIDGTAERGISVKRRELNYESMSEPELQVPFSSVSLPEDIGSFSGDVGKSACSLYVSSLGGCVPDVEAPIVAESLLQMDNVNVPVVSSSDHSMSQADVTVFNGGDNITVGQNVETSKELWDTLEAKYMAEYASSKKFLVSNFTNYKMTDSRLVLEQYNELLGIIRRFQALLTILRMELTHDLSGTVICELRNNNPSRYNDNKGKRKHHDTRASPNKKPKVTCWKYGKPGHLKKDSKAGNVGNKTNGSSTKGSEDGSSNPPKAYFVQDDDIAWLVDSGAKNCACVVLKAVVRLPDSKLKTLGERGIKCIFVGYAEHSKAFRFYVIEPNDSVAINSIIESRDAIFDEKRFSSVPRLSQIDGTDESGGSVISEKVTDEIVQQSEPQLRKSRRHRTPKDFGPEFQLYLIEGTRDEVSDQHSYCFNVEDDPKTFDEAMKSQDVAFWKEAINDEMDSIMGNNT
ncbi:hypothetical protein Tco_1569624 [Tanacetum coccineum]